MHIAELARRAGIAPSAVRFDEEIGALPGARRRDNGYREYEVSDLARLRLVVALRRLGLAPVDAGRLARLCLERGEIDTDLGPLLAEQHAAIERRRVELDRLDSELSDLEETVRAAQSAKERPVSVPIRVLFVCTGNSARSQFAEALVREIGGPDFEVFSAGTEPKAVSPYTIRALAEIGVDWSRARSKSVTEFLDQPFDYVVTVCDRARQVCPVFPGQHNTLHWGLEDPADIDGTDAEKLEAFRRTRMEVAMRVRPFVELARKARRDAPEAVAG